MFKKLIARVEALSGADREVDRDLQKAFDLGSGGFTCDEFNNWPIRVTASIDAALAFAERVLPGCEVRVAKYPDFRMTTSIWVLGNRYGNWMPTLPLAIILATLKAKEN